MDGPTDSPSSSGKDDQVNFDDLLFVKTVFSIVKSRIIFYLEPLPNVKTAFSILSREASLQRNGSLSSIQSSLLSSKSQSNAFNSMFNNRFNSNSSNKNKNQVV